MDEQEYDVEGIPEHTDPSTGEAAEPEAPGTAMEVATTPPPAVTPAAGNITMASLQVIEAQATMLAGSSIIPRDYQGNAANIIAAGITGAAFGWDVMTAMRHGHVIEGKYSLSAEAMVGLVRSAGHQITGETGADGAVATGKRRDTGDTLTVTFTMDDAARAQLTGKDNWRKYPQAMCWARTVSMLCRMLFSDVLLGVVYTPDELGAVTDESGAPLDVPSWEPTPTVSERGQRAQASETPADPGRLAELYEAMMALPDGLQSELKAAWANSPLAGYSAKAGHHQPIPRKHMGRARSMVNSYWAKARDIGVDKTEAIQAYRLLQEAAEAQASDGADPAPEVATPMDVQVDVPQDAAVPGDDTEDAVVVDETPPPAPDWHAAQVSLAQIVRDVRRDVPNAETIEAEIHDLHHARLNRLLTLAGEDSTYPPDSPIDLRRMAAQLMAYETGGLAQLWAELDPAAADDGATDA